MDENRKTNQAHNTNASNPTALHRPLRPLPPASAPEEIRIEWLNACSRGNLIAPLLLDERPGYLAQMVEATYPGHNPGG